MMHSRTRILCSKKRRMRHFYMFVLVLVCLPLSYKPPPVPSVRLCSTGEPTDASPGSRICWLLCVWLAESSARGLEGQCFSQQLCLFSTQIPLRFQLSPGDSGSQLLPLTFKSGEAIALGCGSSLGCLTILCWTSQ